RRLSIIDLSEGGHQPMTTESLVITFNGEIYNYREIKKELVALGHQFRSESDTEVILHAYLEWGEDMIKRLNGMFAFSLLDHAHNKMIVVRDRAGIKPLYYYKDDRILMFASELKPFYEHHNFPKVINVEAAKLFFQYGYIPAPHSIFEGAFKLNPGHYLRIDLKDRSHKFYSTRIVRTSKDVLGTKRVNFISKLHI
ncbi:MAG: hypothetical protein AAF587_45025, partial [Bacteroidota bacterium]